MKNPLLELRHLLESRSQVDVAKQLGISTQYLSDILHDRRQLGKKILDGMGLERVVTYAWTGNAGPQW
jgi:transcriptional regulator with XRE-family HTH domain